MIEDMRAGLAPAATYAVNRAPGSEPMGPLDYFPWHRDRAEAPPQPESFEPSALGQEDARRKIFSLSTPG